MAINNEYFRRIRKHEKSRLSSCYTELYPERSQSNQRLNRVGLCSGGVCSFVYIDKISGGRTRFNDKHRNGRPHKAEIAKKIHKMTLNDRRLKVRELAALRV